VGGVLGQYVENVDGRGIVADQNSDYRSPHPNCRLIDVSPIKLYPGHKDRREALRRNKNLSFIVTGQSPEYLLSLLPTA
jgi:hypothetical protein